MSSSQPVKKKIAILGGGLASLTTAFALTSQRDWRSRYEITVYQMGWRLGGKGASGRITAAKSSRHGSPARMRSHANDQAIASRW